MSRASKIPVRKNIQEELEENFAYLISSLTSPNDIQRFFTDFLTDEEKIMLSKRLMLHLMLENRYDPADIKTVLGLSRETIRSHKGVWLTGGKTYKAIIAKIAKRNKTKEFWKKVEAILRPLDLFLQSKSNMKARAKLLSGDYG